MDLSVIAQINQIAEKETTPIQQSEVEQIKNKDILASNKDTIEKIEKERKILTAEKENGKNDGVLVRRSENYSTYTKPKVEEKKTTTTTSTSTTSTTRYTSYGTGYYSSQSNTPQQTPKQKAREYSEKIVKEAIKQAREEVEKKKKAKDDWDIFELQQRTVAAKRRKKKSYSEKEEKKDKRKVMLLSALIVLGKSMIEQIYEKYEK